MSRYIALIHRGETGSWGISFPDFPGCVSAADSFEDVMERGAEALRFHVEGMLQDGTAIPKPRRLEALSGDPEFADDFAGAIVGLVPLLPPRDTPMRVNVMLDSNLLASIDRTAETLGLNRSEFLAEGARRMILTPEARVKPDPRERRGLGNELSDSVAPGDPRVDPATGQFIAVKRASRPPPDDLPKGHRPGGRVLRWKAAKKKR